ncbi:hypothetical protein N3K66_002040 [Trichothecium roseum]|uniref:Uncharacterized protein n=1 Tax=Trichothecium roseum TaxID=47278 RepID=A0ACC0VA88_9HYPO|nr:hypothetical protein N3K66_002040 [Trichothecium roseum]
MASTTPLSPPGSLRNMNRQSSITSPKPRPAPLNLSSISNVEQEAQQAEKLSRRESRLGLRNIFGRTKGAKPNDGPQSPRFVSKAATLGGRMGMSVPLTPSTNKPYENHPMPSNKPIAVSRISRPLSTFVEDSEPLDPDVQQRVATARPKTAKSTKVKSDGTSWAAPPLFKAYPQATKWITLPAPTTSADSMLKAQEKRLDQTVETSGDGTERDRFGRRRAKTNSGSESKVEWTRKIYLLIPSGFVLEYAAEGPFDRLPEKMLKLSQNSAVFASDMIPGKHWVLQVAASFGNEEPVTAESKSIFSKFPFRGGAEKRQALNLLMVFERTIEMNDWLSSIRGAIEERGGKQGFTETGKPRQSQMGLPLRQQISQRTLVVKEGDRNSNKSLLRENQWEHDSARRASTASFGTSASAREQSLDGASATNSIVSTDGQQLESLRGSSNRLSHLSSGQRTFLTSAGSSPACSPTVEKFPALPEDSTRRVRELTAAESRLRPNASAILDRRRSLQTMGPFVDSNGQPMERPLSTTMGSPPPGEDPRASLVQSPTPNFSVPHSSNRRFSYMKQIPASPTDSPAPLSPPLEADELASPSASPARRPPTALKNTRPLSMVADQPSPKEEGPERPATQHGDSRPSTRLEGALPMPDVLPGSAVTSPPDTPDIGSLVSLNFQPRKSPSPDDFVAPRRLSSLGALRQSSESGRSTRAETSQLPPPVRLRNPPAKRFDDSKRCHSSIDTYERPGALSPLSPPSVRVSKRASMHSFVPPTQMPAPAAPPPSIPLPPIPKSKPIRESRLKVDGHPIMNRRSMPQLVEGPPPAPPPTCALPPIPKKSSPKA